MFNMVVLTQDNYGHQKHGMILNRVLNPLPDDKILDWSKLKQIADDISKNI